ncbi:ATP-binding protein [Neptunicella marina]|uniref:histidine kinase n=1 Tax=Neptunicella marina TaxID=2125989 RepID=A0A8J6ITH5_9ALTE|nr:ATP-binding protein [Neptunicella marina]MBC3765507.1 HAMP domain-containing protein [Neptunicella marina]
MTKFIPGNIKSRAILLLCGTFILAQFVSLLIYEKARDDTILMTEAHDLAERITGIVALAEKMPDANRREILQAAQTQFLSMYPAVRSTSEISCEQSTLAEEMLEDMHAVFSQLKDHQLDICIRQLSSLNMLPASDNNKGLDVIITIQFPDQSQSMFHAELPVKSTLFGDVVLFYILILTAIALLTAWYFIVRLLRPIETLASAAEEIGINIDAPPMQEKGAREIQIAARTFNTMQGRIQRLIHSQTEMLAAISHDLKSALTRLQLRCDLLNDDKEREGLTRVVDDMKQMVNSSIEFIRGNNSTEQYRNTNFTTLLDTLCQDLIDEGLPVIWHNHNNEIVLKCRPVAIRRGIHNIIDNAIKYGQQAQVSLSADDKQVKIRVQDKGNGIEPDKQDYVLMPFSRLDKSRNKKTGGLGLGLSITKNIVLAHGGQLTLQNAEQGGLLVTIVLPLPDQ